MRLFIQTLVIHLLLSFHAADTIRGALDHTMLRCCVVQEPPIALIDETEYSNGGIGGLVAEYLREMQGLLGWKCSSVRAYSNGSTTSFNSFVHMMDRCSENGLIKNDSQCVCDIGASGWFPTYDRYPRVDFLPPFVIEGYRIIFHNSISDTEEDDLFFLTAFDLRSWLCIIALIVLFSICKLLDSRFVPRLRGVSFRRTDSRFLRFMRSLRRTGTCYRFLRALLSVFGAIITQTETEDEQRRHGIYRSILHLMLGTIGLILILSYEASMTASLVQERIVSKFQSAEDFRSCQIAPEDVCLPGGGAMELFWNRSIAGGSICHENRKPWIGSYREMYKRLDNGSCKYAMLLDSTANTFVNEKYCGQYLLSDKSIFRDGLAMVLPKGSNLTEIMSLATLKLRGEALLPTMDRFFQGQRVCAAAGSTSLPFRKLRLFFLLAFAACALYIIFMVFLRRVRYRNTLENGESAAGAEQASDLPAPSTNV